MSAGFVSTDHVGYLRTQDRPTRIPAERGCRPRRARLARSAIHVILINFPLPALTPNRGSVRHELNSLSALAGMCRQYGFACTVLDAVVDPALASVGTLVQHIARHARVVLGFHLMGIAWLRGAQAIMQALQTQPVEICQVLAGGNYATIYRQEVIESFSQLDVLLLGESEFALIRILHEVLRGKPRLGRPTMSAFQTVDPSCTAPAHHYAAGLPGIEPIDVLSSRGCPGRCTFCEVACFYGKTRDPWRRRSLPVVYREIRQLHEHTGQSTFGFLDDAFLSLGESPQRLRDLISTLRILSHRIPDFAFSIYAKPETVTLELFSRLREVGLRRVFLGIESFNERWLRRLRKAHTPAIGVHALEVMAKLEMVTDMGFIMISPEFDIDDVAHELDMLAAHANFPGMVPAKLAAATSNAVLLYRHTKLYEIFQRQGWLRESVYDSEYEIYGYGVDPLVGAYRVVVDTLGARMPPVTDLADARRVLELARTVCGQLRARTASARVAAHA